MASFKTHQEHRWSEAFQDRYDALVEGRLSAKECDDFFLEMDESEEGREAFSELFQVENALRNWHAPEPSQNLTDRVFQAILADKTNVADDFSEENVVGTLDDDAQTTQAASPRIVPLFSRACQGVSKLTGCGKTKSERRQEQELLLEKVELLLDDWEAPEPAEDLAARTFQRILAVSSVAETQLDEVSSDASSTEATALPTQKSFPLPVLWSRKVGVAAFSSAAALLLAVFSGMSWESPQQTRIERHLSVVTRPSLPGAGMQLRKKIANKKVDLANLAVELETSRAEAGLDRSGYHLLVDAISDLADSDVQDATTQDSPQRIHHSISLEL